MTDVWLPDTTILVNPLGRKIRNVLCIEDLSTIPLQMGPIRYRIDIKQKCMCGHQEVVDIFTVHKFMKANCKAAQLHQDVIQVIQQLVATGKPLQNSSYANKKIRNKRLQEKEKVLVMSYWCWTH